MTAFLEFDVGDSYFLKHTELRMDPTYATYIVWVRVVLLDIIPLPLLVFFSSKVYLNKGVRIQLSR